MTAIREIFVTDILDKMRAAIKFTIWEAPGKRVDKLSTNNAYQKIECKYAEKPDSPGGIKVDFLLGYNEDGWCLWAGKPGVVTYLDDPYKCLEEQDFYNAVNVAVDKCVELIKQIKKQPYNWVQYYVSV